MHACCRPPGEKGGQGGMGDNQGVVLLTHQVPQLGLCPKISGGGHALFKGKDDTRSASGRSGSVPPQATSTFHPRARKARR